MPPHINQVNSDPHTKTKYFEPLHNIQVNFDHYTEVKSISIPTMKWNLFWYLDTKIKLILDP